MYNYGAGLFVYGSMFDHHSIKPEDQKIKNYPEIRYSNDREKKIASDILSKTAREFADNSIILQSEINGLNINSPPFLMDDTVCQINITLGFEPNTAYDKMILLTNTCVWSELRSTAKIDFGAAKEYSNKIMELAKKTVDSAVKEHPDLKTAAQIPFFIKCLGTDIYKYNALDEELFSNNCLETKKPPIAKLIKKDLMAMHRHKKPYTHGVIELLRDGCTQKLAYYESMLLDIRGIDYAAVTNTSNLKDIFKMLHSGVIDPLIFQNYWNSERLVF